MIMTDLNGALEWVAGEEARKHGGEAQVYASSLHDRLLGFGSDKGEAVRVGIENREMSWPYPNDVPYGTVSWWQVAEDYDNAGLTHFYDTPHGVLWVNSE